MKYYSIVFILCLCSGYAFGQKQITYCQTGLSPYGSNCYILKKQNKQKNTGTFERIQGFDDGQEEIGKGKYAEYKDRIEFSKMAFIRKVYNVKRDSVLKYDTVIIPARTFYKHGHHLVEYDIKKTGEKHRRKTIYSNLESEWH